jgi:glycosyltransferase involved in cell wall biosynthesis
VRSLHLITTDARRGAETFAVELVQALRRHGCEADAVALAPSGSAAVHDVPSLGPKRRSIRTIRSLRREARTADVVVAHGSSTLEACALGLNGTGTPFIYRTIGDPQYWVTTSPRQRVIGAMLRRATAHVVLWEGAASQLAARYQIASDRIWVIPNAVPSESFHVATQEQRSEARVRFGLERGQPCLAFVGALSPEKDVRTAIDACAATPGSTLLVAGDGPEFEDLQDHAGRAAPGRIVFLGALADPRDVYAAADVLLLPSLSEGMPAVMLEAGLVGTPTIATAVGSIPEVLRDGETGFVVPVASSESFVAAVQPALARGTEVGRNAAKSFRRTLTLDATINDWLRLLERVGC